MWEDVIVEEVRQARERHAEQFNFDLWAIFHDLKQQENAGQRQLVTFPPRKRRRSRALTKVKQPHVLHGSQAAT